MPRAAVVAASGGCGASGLFSALPPFVPRSVSAPALRDSGGTFWSLLASSLGKHILVNGSAGGSAGKHTGKKQFHPIGFHLSLSQLWYCCSEALAVKVLLAGRDYFVELG